MSNDLTRTDDLTATPEFIATSDVAGPPDLGGDSGTGTDLTRTYDRATFLFENKEFVKAAELFATLVEEEPDHLEVRLLLARSYYHSAQLGRAESALTEVVGRWPSEAYAHLLLARTLQRAGRAEDGRQHLKIAEAMGLTD